MSFLPQINTIEPLPGLTSDLSSVNNKLVSGTFDADAQYFKYPSNLGSPPFDKWVWFEAKSGRHVVRDQVVNEGSGPDRTISSVGLYLSETALKNSLSIAYEENALGPFMGAIIELFAQSGTDLRSTIASVGNDWSGKLKQALSSPGQFISAAGEMGAAALEKAGVIAQRVVNTADKSFGSMINADIFAGLDNLTGGGAGAIFGQRPNPRTDVLFDTQEYRTYDMSFLLVPKSEAEAIQIDRIIHFFQFYALPKYEQPGTKTSIGSFMLGFPYEFEISLRNGANQRLEHVNKFERCVLTNIIVDHAAGGKTAFVKTSSGELYPVATQLSLSFKEVRLLDRNSDAITRETASNLPDPRT